MKSSLLNHSTRFACSLVCSAVLCFSSVRATADVTNDVSSILYYLRNIYNVGIWTYPYADPNTKLYFDDYFTPYLDDLLSALYQTSIGPANPSDAYLYRIDQRQADILRSLFSLTNDLSVIRSTTSDINTEVGSIDSLLYQLFNEYTGGDYSYAWNVHVLNDGTADLIASFSNRIDWLAFEIGQYVGNELHVDLSPITDILYSFQAQQYNINDAATTEGHQMAGTVDQWVETGDANDSDTQSDAEDDMRDTDEPEMDDYQTASSTSDTYDVDKDDLLDNLPDDNLSHSPIITLIDAAHFFRATGVRGDMEFNMNHGNFGSFVADMSTICRAGWRGLLAVLSALLFWRKQNEISAIVRASNISRVD